MREKPLRRKARRLSDGRLRKGDVAARLKMGEFERQALKSELFANPARCEIGFSIAPIDLAVFQDREVEGETVIVPGLAAAGVGDDLAGLRATLRKNLVLFGVVPIGRDDLDLDAAFLAFGDELSAQFRNVRMQVINIAGVDHVSAP